MKTQNLCLLEQYWKITNLAFLRLLRLLVNRLHKQFFLHNLINLLISESEYIYRVVSLLNGLSCGVTFLSEKTHY